MMSTICLQFAAVDRSSNSYRLQIPNTNFCEPNFKQSKHIHAARLILVKNQIKRTPRTEPGYAACKASFPDILIFHFGSHTLYMQPWR